MEGLEEISWKGCRATLSRLAVLLCYCGLRLYGDDRFVRDSVIQIVE